MPFEISNEKPFVINWREACPLGIYMKCAEKEPSLFVSAMNGLPKIEITFEKVLPTDTAASS